MNDERASDLLYHYTDQHGLVGIIEKRELWATSLGCLNDLSEFKHGLDLIRSSRDAIIDDLLSGKQRDHPETKSAARVFKYLMDEAERRYLMKDPAEYLFAFSLLGPSRHPNSNASEDDPGDCLQQWRTYSKGGAGYCIGFDKMLLESKAKELDNATQATFCGECVYDGPQKREIAKRIAKILAPACDLAVSFAYPETDAGRHALENAIAGLSHELEEIRGACGIAPSGETEGDLHPSRPVARDLISRTLATYFGRVLIDSALMKHTAFAEEREWRLVRLAFALSREIKFRTTTRGIVPYAVVPIVGSEDPKQIIPGLIKRVVVGPLGNASHDARSRAISIVKMLLENNGIEVAQTQGGPGAVVEASRLPC